MLCPRLCAPATIEFQFIYNGSRLAKIGAIQNEIMRNTRSEPTDKRYCTSKHIKDRAGFSCTVFLLY